MCLSPLLLAVLVCCPPADPPAESVPADEPEIQVVENLNVFLPDGTPAPERLAGTAEESLTLRLEYAPCDLDESIYNRDVLAPEDWRIVGAVADDDAKVANLYIDQEFRSYDYMGYCSVGNLSDVEKVFWISPHPPAEQVAGTHYRWGRIDLPETPGDYRVTITVYPTADDEWLPNVIGQDPLPKSGPGYVIYEGEVAVAPSTHPLRAGATLTTTYVTPESRASILDMLKRAGEN
jgi:hypothetical protein